MHCLVAAVAIHLTAMRLVGCAANDAWLPDFDREQLVFHYHSRVDLCLLHLILHRITIDHRPADRLAQLHRVEFGAAYRATVRALNPRLETGVVQVVSAGQKMGYDFVIVIDTTHRRTLA
jgi:hypothetical protein